METITTCREKLAKVFMPRRLWHLVILSVSALLVCFWVSHVIPVRMEPKFMEVYHTDRSHNESHKSFKEHISEASSESKVVILALVDSGFVDMAVNFYQTSIKPFHIENYLFVGASRKACEDLRALHLRCYTYTEDSSGDRPSVYLSPDFIRKMNIRTDMILDALSVGITVIHTDLDVVFLSDPRSELGRQESELAALWDDSAYNAGFLIVRPTTGGLWIYNKVEEITNKSTTTDDQSALNRAINECLTYNPPCKVSALPTNRYLNGMYYFENGARMFAGQNPCSDCTVVHNNWIVSKEAKVYRFKENLLWWNDQDGYYSSETRNYLMYQNPPVSQDKSLELETDALENALLIGEILNRTVILARFHCLESDSFCPLNSFYKISAFDEAFAGMYRESSFLSHPLVPKSVKTSLSKVYRIDGGSTPIEGTNQAKHVVIVKPAATEGATPNEILQWFSKITDRVLVFDHLHDVFQELEDKSFNVQSKLEQAFQASNYRQYQ